MCKVEMVLVAENVGNNDSMLDLAGRNTFLKHIKSEVIIFMSTILKAKLWQ